MKDLGDYHDLYMKTNVLLLSNIFKTFRMTCLKHYALDLAHFYISPGLAWQAFLKKTEVSLELLTYPNMLLMFEQVLKMASLRQFIGIHRQTISTWTIGSTLGKRVVTFGTLANNLYGWAMVQKLPTGGFKWVEKPDELKGNISKLAKETGKSYLLEADVSCPNDLHNLHNDLPFMCEKKKINGVQKLVPNLYDKKKYMTRITVLDQALRQGLVLNKVHQAIEFDQSAWLAPYIEFNTQLQTRAKNNFKKDFFKLMKNSVFGKMMENIRKHRDINLVKNKETYLKRMMKPDFKLESSTART